MKEKMVETLIGIRNKNGRRAAATGVHRIVYKKIAMSSKVFHAEGFLSRLSPGE